MKQQLLNIVNANPEDAKPVSLLLLLGFFTGIFLATYDVAAPAIFLDFFKDEAVLAQAFLVSGVVGIIATSIFGFLQARISFVVLVIGYLAIMVVASGFIWEQLVVESPSATVVFIGFVLALPFTYISMLIFWGIFGRVFDLKQSKRVIGGIDTGQVVASILALFAIGYVVDKHIVKTSDLLLVSSISAIGMLLAFIWIASSFSLKSKTQQKGKAQTISYFKLLGDRYTMLMAFFIIISLICITFIDYSFLSVTNIQWSTEAEKASFLAKFEATVVIFSFLFQTFVTDWVISNYGLKVALLINPILAVLLTIGALVTGLTMGASPDDVQGFIWFFLAISASKLFIDALKDALDGPSFKLYFLPIDSAIKFDVNTKIEGVITAFAGVVAGGLLILMNQLKLELLYVTVGLIPLLVGWYFVTRNMHINYKETLQNTLKKNSSGENKNKQKESESNKMDDISNLKLLEKTDPGVFEQAVLEVAEKKSGKLKEYAKAKLKFLDIDFDNEKIKNGGSKELRNLAFQAVDQAEVGDVLSITPDRLYNLAKSTKREDRLLSTKLLRGLINDQNIFVLLELLRDSDSIVRKSAIVTARKVKRKETWPLLIEMLSSQTYSYDTASALVSCGRKVLHAIENAFHRSGQSQKVMLKLVHIIGRIGGREATDLLWGKIDFPDRKISRQILLTFSTNNYLATEKQTTVLMDLLHNEIGKALWNSAAKDEIIKSTHTEQLHRALDQELASNYDFIYMILSLIYDSKSIQLVRENIETGTADGIAFAIELLDIFIDKELKPKLFPILDDIEVKEKLIKLQVFYPRQTYKQEDTFNYLLNRDFNNTNRWTKACTLKAISEDPEFELSTGVIAHMFNPDIMLAELASQVIYRSDKNKFYSILGRLNPSVSKRLEAIALDKRNILSTRFHKTLALGNIKALNNYYGLWLSQLANEITEVKLKKGETYQIINEQAMYCIVNGTVKISDRSGNNFIVEKGGIIGELFFDTNIQLDKILSKHDNTTIYMLDNDHFFNVLTNFTGLVQETIEKVSKELNHQLVISK